MEEDEPLVFAATWNVTAINTHPLDMLVTEIQEFVKNPEYDRSVKTIFTDVMFSELQNELIRCKIPGAIELQTFWEKDFCHRVTISQFLEDKTLGIKRLTLIPDRMTSTMYLQDGTILKRPTVMNAHDGGSLDSIDEWWSQWRQFFFHTNVPISSADEPPTPVCNFLVVDSLIKQEEAFSVSLQLLSLAILDTVFVHLLNFVDPTLENVRKELCNTLTRHKMDKICSILLQSCHDHDVIFIQEAGFAMADHARQAPELRDRYALFTPPHLDALCTHNSLILVHRQRFRPTTAADVTPTLLAALHASGPQPAPGDILAVTIENCAAAPWLLVSLHGGRHGLLLTLPTLAALDRVARRTWPRHRLLVGLDASTLFSPPADPADPKHLGPPAPASAPSLPSGGERPAARAEGPGGARRAEDAGELEADAAAGKGGGSPTAAGLGRFLARCGMLSVVGAAAPGADMRAAGAARALPQDQHGKAAPAPRAAGVPAWIVGYEHQVAAMEGVRRDDTGCGALDDTAIHYPPDFPCDHALISAAIRFCPAHHDVAAAATTPPAEGCGHSPAVREEVEPGLPSSRPGNGGTQAGDCGDQASQDHGGEEPRYACGSAAGRYVEAPTRASSSAEPKLVGLLGLGEHPTGWAGPVPAWPCCSWRAEFGRSASAPGGDGPRSVVATYEPSVAGGADGGGGGWPVVGMGGEVLVGGDGPRGVEDEVDALCADNFVRFVRGERGAAERGRRQILASQRRDRSVWVLMGARTFSAAVCKPWGALLVLASTLALLLDVGLAAAALRRYAGLSADRLRLTATVRRAAARGPPERSGVGGLGVLRGGCHDADSREARRWEDGPALTAVLPGAVSLDGWFLVTADGDPGDDAVAWRLELAQAAGPWRELLPPPWARRKAAGGLPLERRATVAVDLRPPWEWVARWVVGPAWLCLCALGAVAWGLAGRGRASALTLMAGYLGAAAATAAAAVSESLSTDRERRSAAGADCVGFLCLSGLAAVLVREQYVLEAFPALFLVLVLTEVVDKLACFTDSLNLAVTVVGKGLPVVSGLALLLGRAVINRWVLRELVKQDRQAYAAAWVQVAQREAEGLRSLRQRARAIAGGLGSADSVRQRHRGRQRSGGEGCWPPRQGVPAATWDSLPRASNIDQLYSQAACVDIFLRRRVLNLAQASSGLLCTRSTQNYHGRYLPPMETSLDEIAFAELKPLDRALEKLLRAYECDASRLLDCCRQRIVFESLADLERCLDAVARDRSLIVVRLKNRLDESYDATLSGGFRNVVINMRLDCAETRRLGIDTHICELQLVHKTFALLQSDESHRRYLILRNCRRAHDCSIIAYGARALSVRWWKRLLARRIAPQVHCTNAQGEETEVMFQNPDANSPTSISNIGPSNVNECMGALSTTDSTTKALLQEQFYRCATSLACYEGSGLDRGRVLVSALAHAAGGSVWDTSQPFAAALCKPYVPSLLILVLATITFNLGLSLATIHAGGAWEARQLRLRALEHFSGEAAAVSLGILDFGPMLGGCALRAEDLPAFRTTSSGDTVTLSFSAPVRGDGWWLRRLVNNASSELGNMTSAAGDCTNMAVVGKCKAPAARFVVEAEDDEGVWTPVGSSSFDWSWAGRPVFAHGLFQWPSPPPPGGRSAELLFDMRLPMVWSAAKLATGLMFIVMCVYIFVICLLGRQLEARWGVAACWFVIFAVEIASAVVFRAEGHATVALVFAVYSLLDLGFTLVFVLDEAYVRHYCGVAGPSYSIMQVTPKLYPTAAVIHYIVFLDHPAGLMGSSLCLENRGLLEGIPIAALSLGATFMRWRSRRNARRLIARDMAAYNAAWAKVLSHDVDGAVERLGQFAHNLASSLPTSRVCQRVPPPYRVADVICELEAEVDNGASTDGVLADLEEAEQALVQDLDQMFALAAGLAPSLRSHVQRWASACDGSFRVEGGGPRGAEFRRWREIEVDAGLRQRVKWARLKTHTRAIEKVYRSYNGDLSLLLDCCRESIFLEDLDRLTKCLEAIAADPAVRLRRVVNRLSQHYDSAQTAGYRDVLLNLQLRTSETRLLCVDVHIAEVQLVLIDFAAIKTEEGHQRYVAWRDQRGA